LSDIKDTGKSESSPAVYVKCTDGIWHLWKFKLWCMCRWSYIFNL